MEIRFRSDINALRALAVSLVVLFHFELPGFSGGFVGVDVFFVISGFLMSQIIISRLDSGGFSLSVFYVARLIRILPAFIFLVAVLLIFGYFFLSQVEYRKLGSDAVYGLTFISNFEYYLEAGYFDSSSMEKWLLHTWSLSVEWQYYIFIPLFSLGVWKVRPGIRSQVVLLAAIFFTSFLLSINISSSDKSQSFFLLHCRAWELAIGALCYIYSRKNPKGRLSLALLGMLLISISAMFINESFAWPGWLALVPVLGAVFVLNANVRCGVFENRLVQYVGLASYSIYLWHWPIVVLQNYLYLSEYLAADIVGLLLSVITGTLSYLIIEKPSREVLRTLKKGYAFGAIAVSAGIVSSSAFAVHRFDGVRGRLPALVDSTADEEKNTNPRIKQCLVSVGTSSPSCLYGDSEVGAIVLGDSHANAVVTSIAAAAHTAGKSVVEWSYTGCPSLRGAKRLANPFGKEHDCEGFNEWVSEQVLSDEVYPYSVPLIVVNRWSSYIFGNYQFSTQISKPYIYFTKIYESSSDGFLSEFRRRYIRDMCELSRVRKVFILGPIPEMSVHVPRFMSRNYAFGVRDREVVLSLENYRSRNEFFLGLQREVSDQCGVKFLNVEPYFCDSIGCAGARDGRPIYFDDDHLSEYGNRVLIPLFREVFSN